MPLGASLWCDDLARNKQSAGGSTALLSNDNVMYSPLLSRVYEDNLHIALPNTHTATSRTVKGLELVSFSLETTY